MRDTKLINAYVVQQAREKKKTRIIQSVKKRSRNWS